MFVAAFQATPINAKNAPLPFALPATFQGVENCSGCPGFRVALTLYSNSAYWLRRKEIRRYTPDWGGTVETWSYDSNRRVLSLSLPRVGNPPAGVYPAEYLVSGKPPTLQLLDSNGGVVQQAGNQRLSLATLPRFASELQIVWWRVTKLMGKDMPNASKAGGMELGLRLDATDNTLWGVDGCNDVRGSFQASNIELHFKGLNRTNMLCEQKEADIESAFLRMLADVRSYRLRHDALNFYDHNGAMIARLRAGSIVPKAQPI